MFIIFFYFFLFFLKENKQGPSPQILRVTPAKRRMRSFSTGPRKPLLGSHPGGDDILLSKAGTDCTKAIGSKPRGSGVGVGVVLISCWVGSDFNFLDSCFKKLKTFLDL